MMITPVPPPASPPPGSHRGGMPFSLLFAGLLAVLLLAAVGTVATPAAQASLPVIDLSTALWD